VKSYLRKLLIISGLCFSVFAGSVSAAAITQAQTSYDDVAYNYTVIGPATRTYNCLAYALGITSYWVWPWNSETATQSQVDTYLSQMGYSGSPFGYVYSIPGIISYGPGPNSINHFARATAAYVAKAKWGEAELMQTSWDPYKPTGPYGPAQRYYN
jgi:hypothetical protein